MKKHKKKRNSKTRTKHSRGQAGFMKFDKNSYMSKKMLFTNNRLVLGLGVGGIVVLIILSLVFLFGNEGPLSPTQDQRVPGESSIRVNLTPYPTIPEVTDTTVMINSRRFNPSRTTIKAGYSVGFLNIGDESVTLEATSQASSVLSIGLIVPNDLKEVIIDEPGTYTYRSVENPEITGTVIVEN